MSYVSTQSAKDKSPKKPRQPLRLTSWGKIILIGIPIGAVLMLLGVVIERATNLFISELVILWIIIIIGIISRQNKKLQDKAKGNSK